MSAPVVEFRIGDVLRLRKPHPCGGLEWQVYRLGADIGLRCQTCGRHVMLARPVLEKRLKKFLSRGAEIPLTMFFPNLENEQRERDEQHEAHLTAAAGAIAGDTADPARPAEEVG